MLRWILLIVVVVGLTAAATFVIQSAPVADSRTRHAVDESLGPRPKVEIVEPLIHEFGIMSQESNGSHTWQIKNVGQGTLDIWLDGRPTCSCTIASLQTVGEGGESERKVVKIKPGDSTKIDLAWETRNKGVEYSQGATIGTNDPSRPSFALTVKGQVFPPVSVYPPEMISLMGISNEEVNRARFAVFSMDRPSTKITKISSSRPEFIVATPTPLTDTDRLQLKVKGGGYRVDVDVKPGLPLGAFQDELVIETDHPLRPKVKVTVAGKTTGPISFLPERVRMTNVTSSRGATQEITLLVRGDKPTKFEIVHKPSKVDIEIKQSDTAQKGRYRLKATVPPGTPAGQIDEDLIIKTDHPRASELKIPVIIWISNSDTG